MFEVDQSGQTSCERVNGKSAKMQISRSREESEDGVYLSMNSATREFVVGDKAQHMTREHSQEQVREQTMEPRQLEQVRWSPMAKE